MWSEHPQLLFILPFRALNLTIIDSYGGLPLYKYDFEKNAKNIDQMLFSGMMQGISTILSEAVHRGTVKEINLSQGRLIIHAKEDSNVIFVLLTTKSSYMLTEALVNFASKFIEKYGEFLKDLNVVDHFRDADNLIKEYFSFIPSYD